LLKRSVRQLHVGRIRQQSVRLRSANKLMHAKLKEQRIRRLATLLRLYNYPKEARERL
jgi:hypothetical protein